MKRRSGKKEDSELFNTHTKMGNDNSIDWVQPEEIPSAFPLEFRIAYNMITTMNSDMKREVEKSKKDLIGMIYGTYDSQNSPFNTVKYMEKTLTSFYKSKKPGHVYIVTFTQLRGLSAALKGNAFSEHRFEVPVSQLVDAVHIDEDKNCGNVSLKDGSGETTILFRTNGLTFGGSCGCLSRGKSFKTETDEMINRVSNACCVPGALGA